MIEIDNVLISDQVVEEQFVCDLAKCKGGCCEDGDAGAPLSHPEMDMLRDIYEKVEPYLTPEGREEIRKKGLYYFDKSFGWVTPTINRKMCAYGYRDSGGVIKCGIEQAFLDGKTKFRKPISCHLFPIKIKETKTYEMVNYEPRPSLCKPACSLGKKLKMPVYVFLKDALIRKYGTEFYAVLEQVAAAYFTEKES